MKQYLESMKHALEHGVSHPDRTKVGRHTVFGTMEKYDLREGFPLVTTRKIATVQLVLELVELFIRGRTNILEVPGLKIWDPWAVRAEDVAKFVAKSRGHDNEATAQEVEMEAGFEEAFASEIGSIGHMYGAVWRNAPTHMLPYPVHPITYDELPSDKKELYKKEFEEANFLSNGKMPGTLESFSITRYYQTVDQLNELIRNLKARPHSSRHCITAWIPALIPEETVSPQENVLNRRGALAPCHAMFQFFVMPAKNGEPKVLDCLMFIR